MGGYSVTLQDMGARSDILLVGQTPPPLHGQAVVTAMVFNHDWGDLKVERLRMAFSDTIDEVGKPSFWKIWHLITLIVKTWICVIKSRPRIIYYLPASANKAPVLRDVVYLFMVRWCFSKTVFHYHAGGLPAYLEQMGMLGKLAQRVYSHADVSIDVIKTEPATGSFLQSKKNTVVNNGVDAVPVPRTRLDDGKFQILFVGILSEGKGILEIVKTATLLKKGDIDCQFVVVGGWSSHEFKEEVELEIKKLYLEDNFVFPGPLLGEDKWQTYANADCFFFPSHYAAETFGLVLVEAMAFGLPLVTTKWRGIPLVVEGGDCAELCDIRSPEQFAGAIEKLNHDSELCKKMGASARQHYSSNYTRERFTKDIERVFREILDSKESDE